MTKKRSTKITNSTRKSKPRTVPQAPPKKAKGLPVKRVVDIDKKEELRQSLEVLPDRPPSQRSLPSVVPDGKTEEQLHIKAAKQYAVMLLAEDDIFGAIHAMICMRQGYIVAYREYQELIARKRQLDEEKGEELPVLAEDFLVQYSMWQATKPFNEHAFMELLLKTAMPWLGETIDRHSAEDQKQAQEDHAADEKDRRVRPIPIGFKHTPILEEPVLERTRSLVLVGWNRAVLWLIDQVCKHVLAEAEREDGHAFMVVRFMQSAPRPEDQHRLLARVGGKAWAGCTDSDKKLALCMGEYVADKLSSQPDLVVCDHLPAAHTGGFVGRPDAAMAGDAHRRFRKWCDKAGAAFLGAMCTDDMVAPDITEPSFEQLRTFANLRPVDTHLDEVRGKYLISVGRGAAVIEVDKNEVDSYGHGTIVLPHGVDQIVT